MKQAPFLALLIESFMRDLLKSREEDALESREIYFIFIFTFYYSFDVDSGFVNVLWINQCSLSSYSEVSL
jgi:hypothetical protein